MAKSRTCAALFLSVVVASSAADAWADDVMPAKAPPMLADSKPRLCTDPTDFITTNCQLTWQGITVFGIVDTGFGWQSNGAPFDPRSAPHT